jgi:hypothetical protein
MAIAVGQLVGLVVAGDVLGTAGRMTAERRQEAPSGPLGRRSRGRRDGGRRPPAGGAIAGGPGGSGGMGGAAGPGRASGRGADGERSDPQRAGRGAQGEPLAVSGDLRFDESTRGGAMSTPSPDAYYHLFDVGMQYYVVGRAAALGRQARVAGNLLHHAVEMLLKGELSKLLSLEQIKKQYGHFLVKTWNEFKARHPGEDLSGFDQLVADLDRFEKIRYPDELLAHGAAIAIGWGTRSSGPMQLVGSKVPEYCLYVNEVDALIARLFKICHINPLAYWGVLPSEAVRFLQFENSEYDGWGLPKTTPGQA